MRRAHRSKQSVWCARRTLRNEALASAISRKPYNCVFDQYIERKLESMRLASVKKQIVFFLMVGYLFILNTKSRWAP